MGYRIELGEIEHVLNALQEVSEAAVFSVSDQDGAPPEIIAAVTIDNHGASANAIKSLKARLPAYMTPHKIQVLSSLPRTANGKVDRQRLKHDYLTAENK